MLEALHPGFGEITFLLLAVVVIALCVRLLKLPMLAAYIMAGLVVGPVLGRFDYHSPIIELGQQTAFALLLFMAGLELSWVRLRLHARSGALVAGFLIVGSFLLGLVIAAFLNLSLEAAIITALALSFTSGIAVTKLISEVKDVNSLHGRLTGSVLLVQDIVAIAALMILGGYVGREHLSALEEISLLLIKGGAIAAIFLIFARTILSQLFRWFASSTEMVVLLSLAWCFGATYVMRALGFPLEVGALLAGLCLATLQYGFDVMTKIRTLRDLLLVILFMNLSMAIVPLDQGYWTAAILITLLVIVGRPLIGFLVLSWNGYRSRTAFLTSITQGQLSEFALIFILIGLRGGTLDKQTVSLISIVTISSMLVSTILFAHRLRLYRLLQPVLRLAERGHHFHKEIILGHDELANLKDHAILFGYHRMGYHILRHLKNQKKPVLVVDFNPDVVKHIRQAGIAAIYGDAEDQAIFTAANVSTASLVISTIPHAEENKFIIATTKQQNKKATIIVTAKNIDDALEAYKLGADYVLLPLMLGAEHIGKLLDHHHQGTLQEFIHNKSNELKLIRTKKNALYFE
jgi:Kef-type K+ transport system membrane component KefB